MDLTKSPREVFMGNPVTPLHQPVPADAAQILEEIVAGVDGIGARATNLETTTTDLTGRMAAVEGIATTGAVPKASVATVALTNITLSGAQTVAGVASDSADALAKGVLAIGQTNPAQNGVYIPGAGPWTRRVDLNAAAEFAKASVRVDGGDSAGRTYWQTATITTLGTDPIVWALIADDNGLAAAVAGKVNTADLPKLGVGAGPTNDLSVILAFVDEAGHRTWLEVDTETLGPTALAAMRIIAAMGASPAALQALKDTLGVNGLALNFNDPDIAFAVTFESLERTWLEVAKDGSVTEYSAERILEGLNFGSLSYDQKQTLKAALGVGGSADVVTVSSPPPALPLGSAPQGQGREYPYLVKLDSNPVIMRSEQDAVHILWPQLVDMRQSGEDGIALFYSTDHASHASSGIFLLTAPNIDGPWTQHGRVHRDDTGGAQTETAAVEWDERNVRWLMYVQQQKGGDPGYGDVAGAIAGQVTMVYTAPTILDTEGNPSTWTKIGIALDVPATSSMGQAHTGYFTPFRYNKGWYGYSLFGGGEGSRAALWFSEDGVTWALDARPLTHATPLCTMLAGFTEQHVLARFKGNVVERNGRLWLITIASSPVSGGGEGPTQIVACPLTKDLRHIGRPIDISPPLQAWETGYEDFRAGGALHWNGKTYMAYRAGGKAGGFGIMEIL